MIANFKDKNNTGGSGDKSVVDELNVTKNGTYNVPDGVDAYNPVNVDVPTVTKFDGSQLKLFKFKSDWGVMDNLDTIDVSKITSFNKLFKSNSYLNKLDLSSWNTSNVTNVAEMFSGCTGLNTIDISNWDLSNLEDNYSSYYNWFYACNVLKNIICNGLKLPDINLDYNTRIASLDNLTVDSIVGLLNALPVSTKNNEFCIGNYINKLSDEQKKIATDKGWRLTN